MKLFFPIFCCLCFCRTTFAFAEEVSYNESAEIRSSENNPRFGIFGGYMLGGEYPNFNEFPGYANCCDSFRSGNSNGILFGGLVQLRYDDTWFYGVKLLYRGKLAKLESTQINPITISGILTAGKITNTIDAAINTVGVAPFVALMLPQVANDFFVTAGIEFSTLFLSNFSQYETLEEPAVGTFENGYRVRNYMAAPLPNTNPLIFSINVGVFWELPINKDKNIRIVPEANYQFGISSPISELRWNTSLLTLGVGIKYNKPPIPPMPPLPPVEPQLAPLPVLPSPPQNDSKFVVDVTHKIANNNDGISNEEIVIEDFTQSTLKPLLAYIFFDENSATIPQRYHTISKAQIDTFNINSLKSLNTLETYYYCLDIIGSRLRMYPDATLELVGTNSNNGVEKNNTNLSKKRAEAVKKYLCNSWDIAPVRISVKARDLPKDYTKSVDAVEAAMDENRRVEIYSDISEIVAPIMSHDTFSVVKNHRISFIPTITSQVGVVNSKLTLFRGDLIVMEWNIRDSLQNQIDWELNDSNFSYKSKESLSYQFSATDKIGQTALSNKKIISQKRITVTSKRNNIINGQTNDKEFEYYSLILFDFASDKFDNRHKEIINFIRSRIKPNAKVIVSGYADIIGLPEANKRIAEQRAAETAKRLGIPNIEIRGIGNDDLLYDNTYPEGRFYCRTVTIYIETPISN